MEAVPLTSDLRPLQEPPPVLMEWMRNNDGIAGLGDGDGLNEPPCSRLERLAPRTPRA